MNRLFVTLAAICTVSIIVVTVSTLVNRPATVTLDAKHFKCTDTMPDGLGSRCTNYAYTGVR